MPELCDVVIVQQLGREFAIRYPQVISCTIRCNAIFRSGIAVFVSTLSIGAVHASNLSSALGAVAHSSCPRIFRLRRPVTSCAAIRNGTSRSQKIEIVRRRFGKHGAVSIGAMLAAPSFVVGLSILAEDGKHLRHLKRS
jgi:hypothetical protein